MVQKDIAKIENLSAKLEGYDELLHDVKSILKRGLSKAYQAVDNLKVQSYWQIGERIVREELAHKDRADYGERVVETLAADLNASRRVLFQVVQFYRTYPIVQTLSAQLSWSHYLELITIKNNEERQFYEVQSIRNAWSVRKLRKKIRGKDYQQAKKEGIIITKLPTSLPAPEDVFKDTYSWDFIDLEEKHTESDLEQALLDNIQAVLLEFGNGFAFVSRQQKILIGSQWERIDLLFYHYLLKCFIIVDLKARELKRGDIEQVTRYLTYYRDYKIEEDRDPIALIICKKHKKIDVYYSAGKDRDDIFIAEYKTKLPSEEDIKERLK